MKKKYERLNIAETGYFIGIIVTNASKRDFKKGEIISDAKDSTAKPCKSFTANIICLTKKKFEIGAKFLISVAQQEIECKVKKILEKRTGDVLEKNPTELSYPYLGVVVFERENLIFVEKFDEFPNLGRILLRHNNEEIDAIGTVKNVDKIDIA